MIGYSDDQRESKINFSCKREEAFFKWLSFHRIMRVEKSREMIDLLHRIEKLCKSNNITETKIFDIKRPQEVLRILNMLSKNEKFIEFNNMNDKKMQTALMRYYEFCKANRVEDGEESTRKKMKLETKSVGEVETNISVKVENQKKDKDTENVSNGFREWLRNKQKFTSTMADIYIFYIRKCQKYLKNHGFKDKIFEIRDVSRLENILFRLRRDKAFQVYNRNNGRKLLVVMNKYLSYMYDLSETAKDERKKTIPPKSKTSDVLIAKDEKKKIIPSKSKTSDALIDFLIRKDVTYIDNRIKGGCLWIKGGYELENLVKYCKETFKVSFKYKEQCQKFFNGEQGWWTTDKTDHVHHKKINLKKHNDKIIYPEIESEILDRQVKPVLKIDLSGESYKYDGIYHSYSFELNECVIHDGVKYYISGIIGEVSAVDVGEYFPELKGKVCVHNELGEDVSEKFTVKINHGHLRIQHRNILLYSGSAEKEYDGLPLICDNIRISGDGLIKKTDLEVFTVGSQKLVGSTTNEILYYFTNEKQSKNYHVVTVPGTLKIIERKDKFCVDVRGKSDEFVYDGKIHSVNGFENESVVVNGQHFSVSGITSSASLLHVGTIDTKIGGEPVVIDENGYDVSDQFRINIVPGILNIKKRKVILASESITKEYDGTPLIGNQIKLSGDGFAEGEGVEIRFIGSQLLPGISLNEFSYVPYDSTDIENYEIECVNGKLTVTDRIKPFEVTVSGENREFLYDGEEKTLPEFSNLDIQINGCKFFITGITNVVAATEEGVYTHNKVGSPCVYDAYINDVSGQFYISVIPGVLTIQHNPEYDNHRDDKIDEYDIAIHEIIRKMSGGNDTEESIKKYTRKELEALYYDTKELLNKKGLVNPRYEYLLKEQREVDVLAVLHNRIVREFKNVTLLSEIEINDREFELLMYYFKKKYLHIKEHYKCVFVDVMFSVAMVQIGIRYYENNFWPQVAKAADIEDIDQTSRVWVGGSVTETLLAFGKPVYSKNEYVTNVMMHCFITDSYAKRFFDYLFQYYRMDLERDLSGLKEMDLEYLCESIVNPYSKRKQLLSEYTAMSIRAARGYCRDIIFKALKMIDSSFWDEEYDEQHLTGRLEKRFEEWKEQSDFYQLEKRKSKKDIINGKSIRQFRTPHLKCDLETGQFTIILPSQMVHVSDANQLPVVRWFIVSKRKWEFQCCLSYGYSGYKTDAVSIEIEPEEIFYKYVFLLFSDSSPVRSFVWAEKKAQFFTDNGRWVGGEHLEPGRLFAFGSEDSSVKSAALLYEGREHGVKYYELNIHENDFVCVQEEENYYVGKIPKPGISDKNKIPGVTVSVDDKASDSIPAYDKFPELIVEIEESQYQGTAIIVNGTVNKLSQVEFVDVRVGKTAEKKYYFIFTEKLQGSQAGYNKILVDYPNSQKRLFVEYYMLPDFLYEFVDSPYIFKENGILRVNRNVTDEKIYLDLKQKAQEIVFKMSALKDGVLSICADDNTILHFEVPMLLLSWDRKDWCYKQLGDIWHIDLKSIVYLRYPAITLVLCVGGKNQSISRCSYKQRADSVFDCDLTKLKSYFSENKIIENICMEVEDKKVTLFKIIQKSVLIDMKLSTNLEANWIEAELDILGKSSYFADLYCEDVLIVEKEPISNDMTVHFDIEVETADYTIKVFESEDDFGFDDDYRFVDEKTQALINPTDLIGGCMRINDIKSNEMQILPIASEYAYYLFLEKQISGGTYEGILTAVFHKQSIMYASKAVIEISDVSKAETVRIIRPMKDKKFDFFIHDSEKEAILDTSYLRDKKDRYTLLDPEKYFFCVDCVSPNTKRKQESYEWIENKEKNSRRKFSIWKD